MSKEIKKEEKPKIKAKDHLEISKEKDFIDEIPLDEDKQEAKSQKLKAKSKNTYMI